MQILFLLFYFHTFKTKMNEYFKFLNLNCSNEKYIRVLQEKMLVCTYMHYFHTVIIGQILHVSLSDYAWYLGEFRSLSISVLL